MGRLNFGGKMPFLFQIEKTAQKTGQKNNIADEAIKMKNAEVPLDLAIDIARKRNDKVNPQEVYRIVHSAYMPSKMKPKRAGFLENAPSELEFNNFAADRNYGKQTRGAPTVGDYVRAHGIETGDKVLVKFTSPYFDHPALSQKVIADVLKNPNYTKKVQWPRDDPQTTYEQRVIDKVGADKLNYYIRFEEVKKIEEMSLQGYYIGKKETGEYYDRGDKKDKTLIFTDGFALGGRGCSWLGREPDEHAHVQNYSIDKITPTTKVIVELKNGETVKGTVSDITPESIMISGKEINTNEIKTASLER